MKLKRTPMTVLSAIVALFFIASALVVGIDFAPQGANANVTPLVSTVLGFIGIAIPGLLAAYKAESNHQDLRNGVLVGKVKQALGEYQVENNVDSTLAPPLSSPTNNGSEVSNG